MTPLQWLEITPRALWILAHSAPWWHSVVKLSMVVGGAWLGKREMRAMRAAAAAETSFYNSQRKEDTPNAQSSEATLER
jgi:hypothetical protein